jgi:THO complex subunit 5
MAELRKRRWESTDMQKVKKPLDSLKKTVQTIATASKVSDALYQQGVLDFLELKSANRELQLNTEKKKAETQSKKQEIDNTNLVLYNLNYEKNHFTKQIRSCRDFRGTYSTIDLVDVETFKANAPAELSSVDSSDEHKLMLNRLAYELQERKRLCAEMDELKQKKQSMITSNEKKTLFLSGLQQNLKALEEATLPIQENLGIRQTEFATEFRNAHHLPRPLYVLYLQAVSFRDSFEDTIEVKMEGDVEAAVEWATKQTAVEEQQEEDEDGRELKRRKSSKADRMEDEKKEDVTYAVHPLSVIVKLTASSKKQEATMTFTYLTQLNIVAVESQWDPAKTSSHSLLLHLFPNDSGAESPNPANSSVLPDNSLEFDPERRARPYKWVQWLAGLAFLQSNPSSESCIVPQESFRAVVARIRARVQHRVTLLDELDSLSKKKPQITQEQAGSLFQLPLSCKLVTWQLLGDSQYRVQLDRGDYSLEGLIEVSAEYPVRAPSFKLSFCKHPEGGDRPCIKGAVVDQAASQLTSGPSNTTNNDLEAMEEELNVHYEELLEECNLQTGYNLLSLQVRKLQQCFDIYVSTEPSHSSAKGGKICFRPQRGRVRKRPFQFNTQTGLFDQRR